VAEVVVSVEQRSSIQITVAVAAHSLMAYVYAFRPYNSRWEESLHYNYYMLINYLCAC
jgi:hypothetical protein